MSKKSSSTTTSNQTATMTPNNPEWVTESAQGLQTRINSLLNTDASTLVPGASTLQKQAFGAAQGLGGWQGSSGLAATRAADMTGAPMTAERAAGRSLLDMDLEGYQNPWTESVVDTSLAGYDEQRGMAEAEMRAQQARNQKFSGSGDAIRRAMFDRGTLQDRTGIESSLRAQGFDRAADLATRDLDRETQLATFNAGQANQMTSAERDAQLRATGLLGDLANSSAANSRADLGLLADLGGQEREIERNRLAAEPALLQMIASLNASQPYSLFRGQTTTATGTSKTKGKESGLGTAMDSIGSILQGAGSAAQGAASLAVLSDKRLKTNIETVGKDAAGRRVVSYRYKGEPKDVRRIGHIAQEVEKTDPHAVVKGPGGYRMIDYGLLGDAA